ncbi:nucleotidyl transferase AbiEii/AbiGii toxin family protein [Gordonibacter sp. 28C]|uniref:nucleotidyl transferase AbiEii/AbiGii toxin family protein n=1 Tax=Gordonibacter sp. 28C TaxID=2078569 RepID=UPI001F5415F3|nr:nucleotidyl transferase AbiEii/AbiGii toxin family protein [Gordonibacter sp. 28C]
MFKGATYFSKCHNAIARFSEDVNLGLEVEHATEGQRKRMKAAVTHAVEEMGLAVSNISHPSSKRSSKKTRTAITARTSPPPALRGCDLRGGDEILRVLMRNCIERK